MTTGISLFPASNDLFNELENQINDDVLSYINGHLRVLHVTVKECFLSVADGFQWLRNPFIYPLDVVPSLVRRKNF
jgi:hypothetical protein